MGDEALSGGKGVAGECELIDSWRTIDVGDWPTDETDCRCGKLFVLVASWSLVADRAMSSIWRNEGNCWPGEPASRAGDGACKAGSVSVGSPLDCGMVSWRRPREVSGLVSWECPFVRPGGC
jgi:hypothetical protein